MYITCHLGSTNRTYLLMCRRKKSGNWATPGGGCDFPMARKLACINEDLAFRLSGLKELKEEAGLVLSMLGFRGGVPLAATFGAGRTGAEGAGGDTVR